jgi:nitrite reductase (cytochrome c-552)
MTGPETAPRRRWWLYAGLFLGAAAATAGVTALLLNIAQRKVEAKEHYVKLVDLTEDTIDPAVWGMNFPRQYDSYRRTADNERSGRGGSDGLPPSRLAADPRLVRIFAGYAFGVDYRERRGHAYMLADQDVSERTHKFKQPGACLHCHASVIPAYRQAGGGDLMKGFEAVCALPLAEARQRVEHPVACLDCHDPQTLQLRITRPAFLAGIRELAHSGEPVPHLTSIERWRHGSLDVEHDNRPARKLLQIHCEFLASTPRVPSGQRFSVRCIRRR